MTVLVVTTETDHAADLVVHELTGRGVALLRLDTSQPMELAASFSSTRGWEGELSQSGRTVDLSDVRSVFWRRGPRPIPPAHFTDPGVREFVARENEHGLLGVLGCLTVTWVNHPDAIWRVDRKPHQLTEARRAGLAIPDTVITTRGDAPALKALAARSGRVLYKAFLAQGQTSEDMIPATIVDAADVPAGLDHACTFQGVVDGDAVRVVVVGDDLWAVAIDTDDGAIDWRPRQFAASYRLLDVPEKVRASLMSLQTLWGLRYAAYDFQRAADGTWVFLDANPVGQYGAIAIRAKLPITERICSLLAPETADAQPLG